MDSYMDTPVLANQLRLAYVLYTLPLNINGYVPFLINMLDTIVRKWKYTKQSPLEVVTFFTMLASIVFC